MYLVVALGLALVCLVLLIKTKGWSIEPIEFDGCEVRYAILHHLLYRYTLLEEEEVNAIIRIANKQLRFSFTADRHGIHSFDIPDLNQELSRLAYLTKDVPHLDIDDDIVIINKDNGVRYNPITFDRLLADICHKAMFNDHDKFYARFSFNHHIVRLSYESTHSKHCGSYVLEDRTIT